MGTVFLGGVPTDLEIKILRDKFGVPDEGALITYSAVEEATKLSRKTCRFRTVTFRWRRQLFAEHGVLVGCQPAEGFVVINPTQVSDHAGARLRNAARTIRRADAELRVVDVARLSAQELVAYDHRRRATSTQLLAIDAEKRRPARTLPAPVDQLKKENGR